MNPPSSRPRVLLKPRKAQPFYNRHPWVFSSAIERTEGEPQDGDLVDLISHGDHFVARGLYNSQSKLMVRLYSWDSAREIDAAFWQERIERAYQLRRDLLGLVGPESGYRLISSEADGMSGLTVDVYAGFAVVQLTSLGMAKRQDEILGALQAVIQPRGIYLRTEKGIGTLEGIALQDGPISGEIPPPDLTILEHGLRLRVNLAEGQKTGYYLDQRDNRQAVAKYAAGKRVIDAFCYSGGFGLHAARAGAASVYAIDGSEGALQLARLNAEANGLRGIEFTKADVFVELDRMVQRGEKADIVVLDPPKFARARNAVNEALKGYRRLQSLGLQLLVPGGILVMCCCSGLVEPIALDEVLTQVANGERRELQILERRFAAPDHPVSLTCPESEYLKCLIARVW